MSALVRLLYPLPEVSDSLPAVVRWWERRRLRYNLVVGATGLLTLGVVNLFALLPPQSHGLFFPLPAIVVYAVLANLCYSAGWVVEYASKRLWRDDAPALGPFCFRQGLIFSVGLTLLPVALATIDWGFRILRFLF